MNSAYDAGLTQHPQQVIQTVAPDAFDFEPVSIADCWLFSAEEIERLPGYIHKLPSEDLEGV
jgi:hypothetical protein